VVLLEGDGAAVVGPGVGLDDEALLAPEEVDFVAADLGIDLGLGDAVPAAASRSERVRSVSMPWRRCPLSSAWRIARRRRWDGRRDDARMSSMVRSTVVVGMLAQWVTLGLRSLPRRPPSCGR
jgi:hypothetical protein